MSNRHRAQKQVILELLRSGVRVCPRVAEEHGVTNLRQQIYFLRKRYKYKIITCNKSKETYYWNEELHGD